MRFKSLYQSKPLLIIYLKTFIRDVYKLGRDDFELYFSGF